MRAQAREKEGWSKRSRWSPCTGQTQRTHHGEDDASGTRRLGRHCCRTEQREQRKSARQCSHGGRL